MASKYGETRGMVCAHCGLRYDDFTTGMSFKEVRNLIITIGWCTKKNKIKHGRRNGVLGFWHETKMQMWSVHEGDCRTGAALAKKNKKRKRAA